MSVPGYQVITADEAEERFTVSAEVEHPYADFDGEQEIRLYPGDLHITGDLSAESDEDWVRYNTIVAGNLTVDGDLTWWDHASGNFLLVTGDVKVGNVFLRGCPNVVVRGDLTAVGGIQAHHGDDGGLLVVRGRLTAPIVLSTLSFGLSVGEQPDAVLVADPDRTNCPVDFTEDDLDAVVLPELLDEDGRADEDRIEDALHEGRPILRPTAVPQHRAVLDELDRLLTDPAEVTELDLSGAGLRAFPEQLFGFPNLRSLSLADNPDLGALPAGIGALTGLTELNLRGLRLISLPDELCGLQQLRHLDLTDTELVALPERFGELAALTTLSAGNLGCPLPQSFGALAALEELDLRGYQPVGPQGEQPERIAFPLPLTRLPRLRTLNLSGIRLAELPDDLLRLTTVEELWLGGSLGFLSRLPELHRLPRLRLLDVNGSAADGAPYPDPGLLEAVWPVSTLVELALDRWGEQIVDDPRTEEVRPALTALPDEAFAAMPGLRALDLSGNAFSTLPGSFYRLTELVDVDLRWTRLDRSTLDQLAAALPRVRIDLRDLGTEDVDDPNWLEVHRLVSAGGGDGDPLARLALFESALDRCTPGSAFAEYDRLYALYGTVDAISRLPADRWEQHADRLVEAAELALSLVPPPGPLWHYTDLVAFGEEVTRRVGDELARVLLRRGELDRALSTVDMSLACATELDGDDVRETKVRILLAAGRADEAYQLVDEVLARDPDYDDLADLLDDPGFLAWRAANS